MDIQKIVNFLDTTSDDKDLPRFVTKIRIKTSMLRSDLCNFSDEYIVAKGTITAVKPDNAKRNKATAFKNNAPFINCISKINGAKIANAEK